MTELEDVQGGAKRTSDNESSDGYDMSQWPSSNAGQGQTSGSED
ncbi:MAG: hypothetical protein OXF61_01505 [Acidimicrobiaceae bacterium]|nr:hypothetical protein [Acidimicrobiaceae bacterium]MCY3947858.1 hypothetical protein [Acidimicrobiaceae bacterium]